MRPRWYTRTADAWTQHLDRPGRSRKWPKWRCGFSSRTASTPSPGCCGGYSSAVSSSSVSSCVVSGRWQHRYGLPGVTALPNSPLGRQASSLRAAAPLMRLKNGSLEERERFRRIQELFADLASGRGVELSFQVAQAGGDGSEAETSVTILVTEDDSSSGSSWELPIQLCGAGTWEALVLAEALASPDRVVIMDEPALNLHPGWQQQLLTLLKERAGQSLLITHSPYLLPVEDEDDIYRIVRMSRTNGATLYRAPVVPSPIPAPSYGTTPCPRMLAHSCSPPGRCSSRARPSSAHCRVVRQESVSIELGDPRSLHLAFYAVGSENQFMASLILLAALGSPGSSCATAALFDLTRAGTTSFGRSRRPALHLPACRSGRILSSMIPPRSAGSLSPTLRKRPAATACLRWPLTGIARKTRTASQASRSRHS